MPGAENCKMLGLACFKVNGADDCAHPSDSGARIGKVCAAGADKLGFELGLAAHEQLLHLFGGFVLVILAKITVPTADGDVIGVRGNFLFAKLAILLLAPF